VIYRRNKIVIMIGGRSNDHLGAPKFATALRGLRTGRMSTMGGPRRAWSRDDIAARAGISSGYLTKLEQGRALPSTEVVDRLANALGGDAVIRQHLHDLANPGETSLPARTTDITAVEQAALDGLTPTALAAYVDHTWSVLAANSEYTRIFRGITTCGNVLHWLFRERLSRAVIVEWEMEARLTVAWLRGLMARYPGDPRLMAVYTELCDNGEFCRLWNFGEIALGRHQSTLWVHDLDSGAQKRLLAQVYPSPDPGRTYQLYLGVRAPQTLSAAE
jgi:transcriptional regulator with XRE-family HTH domain